MHTLPNSHSLRRALIATTFLLAVVAVSKARPVGSQTEQEQFPGIGKIKHVIWIIQENHSFDNYFGTFPGANGIPPETALPKRPGGKPCVEPFHMPQGEPLVDLEHSWESAHACYDNGRMDGFVWAEGTPYTMGYYDSTDIPNYWQYAHAYTLCDRYFSSRLFHFLTTPSGRPNSSRWMNHHGVVRGSGKSTFSSTATNSFTPPLNM